ncbi:class I SAM-dependent methyltransferase [Oceanihabitans sp. 2_MG-2023]|uniref:class I SAM-dependent methyltransferase n=1 Tax=Oceanihabitans sp. 2_MG-2023 TaxID=3062661 RepID=UPI0026E3E76B|nr:class I SAM-dependent methyltransferase [Oceanihabitans sp. 2_MG-2023]MDO6597675.1 class I SAM-dependent methyltransferase [Oceanihabitans sp. 2_MG-2023]
MKNFIIKHLPEVLVDFIKLKRKASKKKKQSAKEVFTNIKDSNHWSSVESVSGDGSELSVTIDLRNGLEEIIKEKKIKSILDIPCGDFNWMKEVDLHGVNYTGGDIVSSLILKNKEQFSKSNITFADLDLITSQLPQVDLVFCRDCLVHLSYKDIYKALKNIKSSKSKYVLLTSFVKTEKNKDILTGEWRKLNLEAAPFFLGEPLHIIDEKYFKKEMKYADKSMCLWRVEDIKLPFMLRCYSWII